MSIIHQLPHFDQAIIAIATAQANAGLGVIRLSGQNLEPIIQIICRQSLQPRHAHYLPFYDLDGEIIDQGIALLFPAPHSYTGETVLELQAHGGMILLNMLVKACLKSARKAGVYLRLAQPGEFTQRAYLNHKIDLIQAQAVVDVIHAHSEQAIRSAQRSLQGEFSNKIKYFVNELIHLRMLIEATLDFPEEDIEFIEAYDVKKRLEQLVILLKTTQAQAQQGKILQDGLQVVLVGEPNVGKSSLLNALSGDDVAIVSATPGTTRDRVFAKIELQGLVLNMIDTAGLRETYDEIEKIGIQRTWQAIEEADIILHLNDIQKIQKIQNINNDQEIINNLLAKIKTKAPNAKLLTIYNKLDCVIEYQSNIESQINLTDPILISAKNHIGLDELKEKIFQAAGYTPNQEGVFIARERQLQALSICFEHLSHAQKLLQQGQYTPLDLLAEEARLAQQSLEEITGEFTSDDLLGEIFSSFCIGK